MVTIAPELDGGLDAVALVAGRGIVAAVGHTDASYEVVREAIARGARGATHLFNAMPPLLHRAPGPILALLDDDRVWLELICDGVHMDLDLVRYVVAGQPGRAVLITDAMAAAGCSDGDYQLGDLPVEVCCGVARIAGQDTIAGSTLTLDAALRHAIASGVDWTTAVRAVTVNPAAYLGLSDVGSLAAGHWADAVALDADWNVGRCCAAAIGWSSPGERPALVCPHLPSADRDRRMGRPGVTRVEFVASLPRPDVWVWLGTTTDAERDPQARVAR